MTEHSRTPAQIASMRIAARRNQSSDLRPTWMLPDLQFVGGTPWEEWEWEDGLEAPPKPTWRRTDEWETSDIDLTGDPWAIELARAEAAEAQGRRVYDDPELRPLTRREREAIDRQTAEEAHRADLRRYQKIKYAAAAARKKRIAAEWAARRAAL